MKKSIFLILFVLLIIASCDVLTIKTRENFYDPNAGNYDETQLDLLPPGLISGLSLVPSSIGIDVSWNPPSDSDLAGILVVRSQAAISWTPEDGIEYTTGTDVTSGVTVVFQGSEGSFTDEELVSETVFYYALYTYDNFFNYSAAFSDQVAVPDILAPGEVGDFGASPSTSSVSLSWTEPSDEDFEGIIIARSEEEISWTPARGADYTGVTTPVSAVTIVYNGDASSNSKTKAK